MPSIGIVVPTKQAATTLEACLEPALQVACRPRVLIVDSGSTDATVDIARSMGADVLVIDPATFDHGATRERARIAIGTEIVVMMTQDARPLGGAIDRLVDPLLHGDADASYGRQLARKGASVLEEFDRSFNYPAESHIRARSDIARIGIMAFFLSNAFAAYRSAALDEIGGFPPTLTNEDAIAAARLLQRGRRVAYVADAMVVHSHELSLARTFRRYFDTGYARHQFADLFDVEGGHEHSGRRYVRALFSELARNHPRAIPAAVGMVGAKWLGFRMGSRAMSLPLTLRRRASAQPNYWKRP